MRARRGSSLIIACVILFVVATIATVTLERIIPISHGTRGVEGSNIAYYQAQNGVEAVLMQMNRASPFIQPTATGGAVTSKGYDAGGASFTWVIPAPGEGNSDYSSDWNKVGPNDPVQIFLTGGMDWTKVNFTFRVPQVASLGAVTLSGGYYDLSGTGLVAWTMASSNGAFFGPLSETGAFTVDDVNPSNASQVVGSFNGRTRFDQRDGRDNDAFSETLESFAGNYSPSPTAQPNCDNPANLCSLRLFGIRPIVTASGQTIPYLEYQIRFREANDCTSVGGNNVNHCLPDRFVKISSSGYSYGFRRDIVKKVPQATAVQGLDVTVFN